MGEATQKLTLEAVARGFPETAQAVDAVAEAQKRLIENAKELEQAKLSGATGEVARLTEEHARLTEIVGRAKPKQDGLNESHGHFERVLRSVHPALGEVAAILERYGGVASVAAAAIMGISAAVRTMREELQAATKAIDAQHKALNQLKEQEGERQQDIENQRAGSKLGPFPSAEASDAAFKTFQRIREKFPFIDEEAVAKVVSRTGAEKGLAGGGAFDIEEIARAARIEQVTPDHLNLDKVRPASLEYRVRRALERDKAALDTTFSVEAEQKARGQAKSLTEGQQQGGSTLNLEEIIRRHAPEGADIDALVKLAQRLGSSEEVEYFSKRLEMAISGESPTLHVGLRVGQALQGMGLTDEPKVSATPADLAVLRGAFNEISAQQKRLEEERKKLDEERRKPGTPVSINNTYNNGKWIVPGARHQRSAMVNGESMMRDLERFT